MERYLDLDVEAVTFLYFNVCPKLQVHDLVENDKVVGVQYLRFAITKKGLAFLEYLEKKKIVKSLKESDK